MCCTAKNLEKRNAHFEKKVLIFEKRTAFFLTIFAVWGKHRKNEKYKNLGKNLYSHFPMILPVGGDDTPTMHACI